jgi:D-xylose 1-dehydrogenase (NADP+, D-xylono-1,5-lactone-forming)
VEETFSGQMRFAGEVFVQFDSSFRAPERSFMEFVGTEGVLYVPKPFKPGKNETLILESDGQAQKITVKSHELYLGEIEDMADAILTGKQPRIRIEDSRNNVAAILALYSSARENKPVSL